MKMACRSGKTMARWTCKKAPHVGTGHLHAEDDDGPFDVDGVTYCGRCHSFLPDGETHQVTDGNQNKAPCSCYADDEMVRWDGDLMCPHAPLDKVQAEMRTARDHLLWALIQGCPHNRKDDDILLESAFVRPFADGLRYLVKIGWAEVVHDPTPNGEARDVSVRLTIDPLTLGPKIRGSN